MQTASNREISDCVLVEKGAKADSVCWRAGQEAAQSLPIGQREAFVFNWKCQANIRIVRQNPVLSACKHVQNPLFVPDDGETRPGLLASRLHSTGFETTERSIRWKVHLNFGLKRYN